MRVECSKCKQVYAIIDPMQVIEVLTGGMDCPCGGRVDQIHAKFKTQKKVKA